jgi:hypothetical protein
VGNIRVLHPYLGEGDRGGLNRRDQADGYIVSTHQPRAREEQPRS